MIFFAVMKFIFLFSKEKFNCPVDIVEFGITSLILFSKFNCQGYFSLYLLSIIRELLIDSTLLKSRVFSNSLDPNLNYFEMV